jgi:hypothetical protein
LLTDKSFSSKLLEDLIHPFMNRLARPFPMFCVYGFNQFAHSLFAVKKMFSDKLFCGQEKEPGASIVIKKKPKAFPTYLDSLFQKKHDTRPHEIFLNLGLLSSALSAGNQAFV